MTLPSGADVKIGAYEFMLDPGQDDPYMHGYLSLAPDEQKIQGFEGKTAEKNVLRWGYDDMSGGEGVKFYDPKDPFAFWGGNCNPRVIGSVRPNPSTNTDTLATTGAPTGGLHVAVDGERLWVAGDQDFERSTDGQSFTASGGNPFNGAADYVTAMCRGDGDWPWFAMYDGTNVDICRLKTLTTDEEIMSFAAEPILAMEELNGFVYLWSGKRLLKIPLSQGAGTALKARHIVDAPRETGAFSGTSIQGDMCAAEDGVVYYASQNGHTEVTMYKNKAPIPLMSIPGFTAKGIAYNQGVVLLVGKEYNNATAYAISLRNRTPVPLGQVGWYNDPSNAACVARGPGATFLIGTHDASTNYFYIYDLELDAFSQLGSQAKSGNGTVDRCVFFEGERIFFMAGATTTHYTISYGKDTASVGGSSTFTWDSPAYDFGYPYAQKTLLGVDVMHDPKQSNGVLTLYYQDDEDGTWTALGSATSAGSKHTYIDVASSNITFHTMRFRVVGSSGAIMLNWNARAYISDYQEMWQLKLAIREEKHTSASPTSRHTQAHILRDYLHTLATNKQVVTFLDGKRYPKKGGSNDGYKSHTVVLENPIDHIEADSNDGWVEVTLKAVS